MNDRLTLDVQAALHYAEQTARARHNLYVDVEHIVLGLLANTSQPLATIWEQTNPAILTATIEADLGMVRDTPLEATRGTSTGLQTLFSQAAEEAQSTGHNFINGGHLLLAARQHPATKDALQTIPETVIRDAVMNHSPKPDPKIFKQQQAAIQRSARQAKQQQEKSTQPTTGSGNGLAIVISVIIILAMMAAFATDVFLSFGLVLVVWIFSVTLHEFAHAIVAYWGGDHTVRDKGYLTFNPLKYTHPLLSIGLPVFFVLLGGIGLPGGAVYIETHRLRSKQWRTAVALAGPLSNLIFAAILAIPFAAGWIELPLFPREWEDFGRLESALGFCVMLQVTAVLLNLLPLPPLDGFNAIAPYLPRETEMQLRQFGFLPLLLIFFLFSVPSFNEAFFNQVDIMLEFLQVDPIWWSAGLNLFRFWES